MWIKAHDIFSYPGWYTFKYIFYLVNKYFAEMKSDLFNFVRWVEVYIYHIQKIFILYVLKIKLIRDFYKSKLSFEFQGNPIIGE